MSVYFEKEVRDTETESGVTTGRGLTPDEIKSANIQDEERCKEEMRRKEEAEKARIREERESRDAGLWNEDFVSFIAGSRVIKLFRNVLALLIGVYLSVQFLSFLRLTADPCLPVRWGARIASVGIILAVVWIVCYARRVFSRLPKFKKETYPPDDDPSALVARLKSDYLEKFSKDMHELAKLDRKIDGKEIRLSEDIQTLRSMNVDDPKCWLGQFESFQKNQAGVAKGIVADCAVLVALKTAACPWNFADVIIVFMNTTLMVTALARVFNRKVSSVEAFRLAFKWAVELYVTGRMQEVSEAGVSALVDGANSALGENACDGVLSSFAPVLKKILGKSVEGAVNAYMVHRLGACAIRDFESVYFKSHVQNG